MRDLKNVDIKGVGKSKEYGFVSFTKHEDALETLRNVNNNPNIFTSTRVYLKIIIFLIITLSTILYYLFRKLYCYITSYFYIYFYLFRGQSYPSQ